ncbi:MAG: hypothetical protein ACREYC_00450 [Gammaproteobacteria bacterium]
MVKLADGAKDNWTYLSALLPAGIELVDFYHACDHLKRAFDLAYGEYSSKAKRNLRSTGTSYAMRSPG